MRDNWKLVCDKVSQTKDLKEMEFEKGVATLILSNLGWNEFRDNIEEQYHIEDHAKGYKPDFALFHENKDEPSIFVELKKTGHKQRTKDVKQIRTYMMLTNSRFCIYFGEKMELFFIKIDGTKRTLKSVLTIEYNPKNPDGNRLLDLITYDTYNENRLVCFCEDRLAADEAANYFTSEDGRKRLLELMAKDRQLSEGAAQLLPSMVSLPERKTQTVEDINDTEEPEDPTDTKPTVSASYDKIISDFRNFSERSVGRNTTRNYINHLNNGVSEFFHKIVDQNADSIFSISSGAELKDCIATLKGNEEFVAANKKIRYFFTASLGKYLEFLENRERGSESVSIDPKKDVHTEDRKTPIHFNMKYGEANAKLDYYPQSKRYVIKAGSTIASETQSYCANKVRTAREAVKADETKSKSHGSYFELIEDYTLPKSFDTPSAAAAFCNGGTADGPKRWKDDNGNTYPKEWWK